MPREYTLEELSMLAKAHAQSGLKPELSQAEAFCVMQAGAEAGISPMTSLKHLKVVRGNVSIYAEGMRALILSHGHRITIDKKTDTEAVVTGYRKEDLERGYTVTFTMKDAQKAGLTRSAGKMPSQYELRPAVMLLSRATTMLGREMFADVISGLSYSPEEIEEIEGSDSPTEQAEAKPPADPVPDPEPVVFEGWEQVYSNWQDIVSQIYELNEEAGQSCDKRLFDTFGANLSDLAKNQKNHAQVAETLHKWLEAAMKKFKKAE